MARSGSVVRLIAIEIQNLKAVAIDAELCFVISKIISKNCFFAWRMRESGLVLIRLCERLVAVVIHHRIALREVASLRAVVGIPIAKDSTSFKPSPQNPWKS